MAVSYIHKFTINIKLTMCSRILLEKIKGSRLEKKNPRILRNPKVHCRIHTGAPIVPFLGHTNPALATHPTP
jgi:hypothetical protein